MVLVFSVREQRSVHVPRSRLEPHEIVEPFQAVGVGALLSRSQLLALGDFFALDFRQDLQRPRVPDPGCDSPGCHSGVPSH